MGRVFRIESLFHGVVGDVEIPPGHYDDPLPWVQEAARTMVRWGCGASLYRLKAFMDDCKCSPECECGHEFILTPPNYTKKAKKQHPRVKCYHCGQPVGYQAGARWETFRDAHNRWVAQGKPAPNRAELRALESGPNYDTPEYKKAWNDWLDAVHGQKYLRKLSGIGGNIPPSCCMECQLALRKKGKAIKDSLPATDQRCVICDAPGVPFDEVVCSAECGIKFAKKAIASGFSFELHVHRSLDRLEKRNAEEAEDAT